MALAVASSGVAATLLAEQLRSSCYFISRTAHSVFKLPLNLNIEKSPVCNIGKQSDVVLLYGINALYHMSEP